MKNMSCTEIKQSVVNVQVADTFIIVSITKRTSFYRQSDDVVQKLARLLHCRGDDERHSVLVEAVAPPCCLWAAPCFPPVLRQLSSGLSHNLQDKIQNYTLKIHLYGVKKIHFDKRKKGKEKNKNIRRENSFSHKYWIT